MSEPASSGQLVRTIRLDDEHIGRILSALDEADATPVPERRSARYRYRMKAIVVHMRQLADASPVPYLVPTRDISQTGLAFLFGGFVHVGTKCLVQLITTYGTWNNAVGTVVRCRYVEGNVHEIGIRFDRDVDPALYCAEAVHCRVLLAEDDPSIARLATFHLEQLNAKVDHATNGREAVEMGLRKSYDLIMMDMVMPVLDGFEATKELRRKGYMGMIVAATALTGGPADRERCLKAGCDRYLPKPYTRKDISNLLGSLREEPLFSSFSDDPSMAELINSFVEELPAKIRSLEEALAEEDVKRLEQLARGLKAVGSSYGFEVVTEVAAGIESSLLKGASINDVKSQVEGLAKLLLHTRSSINASGKSEYQQLP